MNVLVGFKLLSFLTLFALTKQKSLLLMEGKRLSKYSHLN